MIEIAAGIILALVLLAVWPYLLLVALPIVLLLWFSTTSWGHAHPNPVLLVLIGYGGVAVVAYLRRRYPKMPLRSSGIRTLSDDEP